MIYFPESYNHSKNKTKFELDLSNYATKSDLKKATGNKLKFAKLADLPSLKLDRLDIDKLVTTLLNLIKLSNVVKK